MMLDSHPSEETLEEYSRGTLPEAEVEAVEEHLLVCPNCQDRLGEIDEFVVAVREAAQELQGEDKQRTRASSPSKSWWTDRLRGLFMVPPLVVTASVAALAVGVALAWQTGVHTAPAAVLLQAVRGGDIAVNASAPAGRPLRLKMDLTGLPAFTPYRVEVVDTRGNRQFESTIRPGGDPNLLLERKLKAGRYWVRVYERERVLLREFGLEVR